MKIALLAHIRHPICEPYMGGMEAHSAALADGLAERGHDVTLFAAPSPGRSDVSPICDTPYELAYPWETWRGTPELDAFQADAFSLAYARIGDGGFDVVHNNSLYPDVITWAARDGVAMVTSQHVPPFAKMRAAVAGATDRAQAQFTVTSRAQLPLWFDDVPANMRVVHNGIAASEWCQDTVRGDHLVWFGRITPNKGLADAVRACRMAGVRLTIVGSMEDPAYFADEVRPWMDHTIRYGGHLSGDDLRHAVCSARAAIVTPKWEEPFGLVAAEALAAGLPVVAYDRGAMREVVGDCGFVVPRDDIGALAAAIRTIDTIDSDACHRRAVEHFSRCAMIDGYEAAYADAMAGAAAFASRSSCSSTVAELA